jgi:hypothetical protein
VRPKWVEFFLFFTHHQEDLGFNRINKKIKEKIKKINEKKKRKKRKKLGEQLNCSYQQCLSPQIF